MKIRVDVLTPNSAERRSTINGPKEIPPRLSGPTLKTSHDLETTITPGISSGALMLNSADISLAGNPIDKSPIIEENNNKKTRDLHQILSGNKLINVINKRKQTVEILQTEFAKIGVNKNNKIQESLIRGSISRSQLVLPETYCPIGIFFSQSINNY